MPEPMADQVPDQRPYATLLAKGEERRRKIVTVAQRLLVRHGWRAITLAQIAREAGISTAGLLHHFDSKEQLLHAVLDARDVSDDAYRQQPGDPLRQMESRAERFHRAPELVGMFAVLLIENLAPDAPLHDRFLTRYRAGVDTIAAFIRQGQDSGRYRTDLDPAVKAVEIVAFLHGMETSWLLDPSIPLSAVFREYARSLAAQLARPAGTP
ncbi:MULTISPECIES: TetR/AcrR family transcriptional regulator [unclassified Streptomyces]|uniref:TetR/AcrR family transcriptional regulator n=1 Tax=unclassified Streptomyces TaxID=2593676 RepID=UPI00278C8920|nr:MULTISPECIES: TetR/AcrR family transcriptional regulator [unclassified Streptomyces]